jgi:uncharacterized membrane protein YeaQ/YmgE (transglycosylase-associated protein family)
MGIIWIILIGFVAGLIARWLSPGPNSPSGFLLTTVLGLVIGPPAWWAHAFFAAWGERILARREGSRPAIG